MIATKDEIASKGQDLLLRAIQDTPIIDHHAHCLLRPEAEAKYSLLSIASEAHDDIQSSRHCLAHLRAVKQLSSALECDATWEAVETAVKRKRTQNDQQWTTRCLSGIECVLVDDGLGNENEMFPHNHLDAFTTSASKRIVRIERVVERLIEKHCMTTDDTHTAWTSINGDFEREIQHAMRDPCVAGFKSVICYRTGLAIPSKINETKALDAFRVAHADWRALPTASSSFKLQHDGVNDYFVHKLATMIRDGSEKHKHQKPIQFHTGLGDNDITLTSASPSHLQAFIRAYPTVPIVLLHSGYPFVRETGYLATTYRNVHADVGEIFPILSRDGQESALRQILELCPSSKILWSTDGHWFPETYFLAVTQIRQVLGTVLTEYVQKGDLSTQQAVELVQNILFNNANKLYDLRLTLKNASITTSLVTQSTRQSQNQHLLSQFLQGKETPIFFSVWWNDLMASPRLRAIPLRRVWSMLASGEDFSFGLATAYCGLLLNETLAPGATAIGEYRLTPDFKTLRPGLRADHVFVMANLKEQDGSPVALCPRTVLQRTLDKAARHGLTFVLGFEMELLFARRTESGYQGIGYPGHNASNVRAFEHEDVMQIIDEAIARLDAAGIYIEMVHAESAPGQYEVILPRAPALEAVENLLYARDLISSCAAARGIRMTMHPKPIAMACGTASHCHISISSPGGSDPAVYEPFYAGILKHLRAIVAFTYSSPASYDRAQDGCWAGGSWIAFGSQNREAPFRKIEGSHWEMKCMDGLANPYLALSAVLSAGTHGVLNKEAMTWSDCTVDPSLLTEAGREEHGIKERIPRSLEESLQALERDKEMCAWMGETLVERYTAVKRTESEFLGGLDAEAQKQWLMERF